MQRFVKGQITFILFGFGFWLPIIVLITVSIFLFTNLEEIGRRILSVFLPESFFHSGFGIAFGILLVYVSGIVLKLTKIGKLFAKIPVLNLLFGAGEIMTVERLLHMSPCLFLFSPTCISYGWILSEERIRCGEERDIYTIVNVYFPNVPTLITGSVFPLRKDAIIKLGNSSKEIIDLLLYAFRSPANLIMPPKATDNIEIGLMNKSISIGLYVIRVIGPAT